MLRLKTGTIRSRLLVSFVLIALLPLVSAAIGSMIVGVITGRQEAYERLESVAASKESAIMGWADLMEQQLVVVSHGDCGYERISVVVSLAQDNKYLQFYNQAVRNCLQGFLEQSQDVQELFVVDAYGRVVLSTNTAREGQSIVGQPYLEHARKAPHVELALSTDDTFGEQSAPMLIAGVPVAVVNGPETGIIGAQASFEVLLGILDDQTGLGITGKSYLVNAEGIVLAASHSIADLSTNDQLNVALGTGLGEALQNRTTLTGVFNDYRGERVIGVYRWLPDLDVLLVVEQNQTEAIQIITATLGVNLVVAITALLLAIGLSLILVRGIVTPLADLADTATQIAAGNLGRAASVVSNDEIGVVASAFNSMTAQLRELITNLEQRVAERTRDLQRLALRLETNARIGREVTSILEISELLPKIAELIQDAFGYHAVLIYLVDEEVNQLVYRGSKKLVPHNTILDIGSGSLNGIVVLQGQALLVNDVAQEPAYRLDKNYPNTRSELVVPLCIGERTIGTLDLQSTEINSFEQEDMLVAQSLGGQIAIAINNAHLYKRSQELAVLEERNRLAREFHDAMNQSLYSIVLFAGAAQKEAEKAKQDSIRRYLLRAESMAQQALKEMRLMLYQLRPQDLEQRGLVGAVQQRLEAVEGSAGVDIQLQIDGEVDLEPAEEDILYRIIQEALNNALKHAAASSVTVSITCQDKQIAVSVIDDGIGFDPASLVNATGLGLDNMRDRAAELGANLCIESAAGEGTSVILSMAVLADNEISKRREGN